MSKRKIIQSTAVVSFFTLISRMTGLLRDVAIAHAFGTRLVADAFFVAFRIPNLFRRLFAEGALTVSFVPNFTESLKKDREEARHVVDASFTLMTVLLVAVSLLGILLAPWFVRLTAWGFSKVPEKFELTVFLTRVLFPYLLLVSLAGLAMGVLNSLKHFGAPAASSIFMNLGIIAGALFFVQWCEPPVLGLAIGALLGGVLQLGIHFPYLWKFGFWPKIRWDPSHPMIKKIITMMLPSAYGAAVYQFNVIVITFLASFLPSGSVSYLWYADRVMEFPLGIFAISVATTILPTLADHAADKNEESFKETFRFGLRLILLITLPAAAGLIVLAEPITRILFQHGAFNVASTQATSSALIAFAIGLPFIAGVRVTANAFYSLHDSKTPVKVANLSVVLNLILCLLLMVPFKHIGLALAISLSSVFNFLMHGIDLRKKIGRLGLKQIFPTVGKAVLASLIMAAVMVILVHRVPLEGNFVKQVFALLFFIAVGAGLYFSSCWALRMEEIQALWVILQKRSLKK